MNKQEPKYDALTISKYVLNKCTKDNCPISNLQLQKILYFLQRDFLIIKKVPLFRDEMEFWQFGPVVPNVYYKYCVYGSLSIREENFAGTIDVEDLRVINRTIERQRDKQPWKLTQEIEGRLLDNIAVVDKKRKMKTKTIFISGKISGDPLYKHRFKDAEKQLEDDPTTHWIILSPAMLPSTGFTWEQYLDITLSMMRQCEAIYMLDGYEESKGARRELIEATQLGKEIIFQDVKIKERKKNE